MFCLLHDVKIHFLYYFQVEVKMSVQYMSFSAHADAKGIMQLIQHCEPSKVLLVHGEASKMEFLKKKINQELGNLFFFFNLSLCSCIDILIKKHIS